MEPGNEDVENKIEEDQMEDAFRGGNQDWKNKGPLWISASILILQALIERYFFDGTRPEL